VGQLKYSDVGLMVAGLEVIFFHSCGVFRHVHRLMAGDWSVSRDDLKYAFERKLSFIPLGDRRQI
jgi:hypothetical protein